MIQNIGCDIVSIKRLTNTLNNTNSFLKRVYSKSEIEEYHKRNDDIHYLATRFAAKEAIVKALTKYNQDLNTIEILNDISGKPYVIINNKIMDNIKISLSYEEDYAIAYVVLLSI